MRLLSLSQTSISKPTCYELASPTGGKSKMAPRWRAIRQRHYHSRIRASLNCVPGGQHAGDAGAHGGPTGIVDDECGKGGEMGPGGTSPGPVGYTPKDSWYGLEKPENMPPC